MEEELNEHDLEERLYAMLHHVDGTAGNVTTNQDIGLHILENAPRSTLRRYWRTSEPTTQYHKSNTPKDPTPTNKQIDVNQTNKPKEEKRDSPVAPVTLDLSMFQSPVPPNIKKTIEIIEHDTEQQVLLESSDEDEVIEVALPPKPTITIESSDEDELQIVNPDSPAKDQRQVSTENKAPTNGDRGVSASPVPSVVSSVSDEFIRGDCIALNISSRRPDNPSFDFSLHGSDLLVPNTPSKKKKKKKTKEALTSTPVAVATPAKTNDECFATPKSKARNKKHRNRLYTVTEKSLPNADVYDSDSNQSTDTNKNLNYKVTETSLPNADVYESDSNLSEIRETLKQSQNIDVDSSDSSRSPNKPNDKILETSNNNNSTTMDDTFETVSFVDLTDNEKYITLDKLGDSTIEESIIIGNVSGFTEGDDYGDENISENDTSKFGSTKIPAILNEDLDFDNLKGKDKVCKRRRYSLTTLRAEMEKFYNESWGGENFNHREIQKSMSRDKSLWVIDPKDRMPSLSRKKLTCNYCNRAGHRDDTCRMKPPVCYMCGSAGHAEPRCPRKICVNCGSPNQMYSTMCRNCCNWGSVSCGECGQRGHPASHCPDLWRRYHNTIDNNSTQLERCNQTKKHYQLFCSGCTRRGHLVHTCRITLPFSGLPINSPYVCIYRPVFTPVCPPNAHDNHAHVAPKQKQILNKSFPQDCSTGNVPLRNDRNKRQSKSPTVHETHVNKKRNVSTGDVNEMRRNTKSPVNTPQRKISVSKDNTEEKREHNKNTTVNTKSQGNLAEKAPNFIPICSTNHDKKGNIIQDNEVSDTSDAVTSARIYVTNDIIEKLKTDEGNRWLKDTNNEHNITVEAAEINSFLSITGKFGDQEAFQAKLRDWVNANTNKEHETSNSEATTPQKSGNDNTFSVISKKRHNLLRQLSKALESLKEDLGDPKAHYKELTYLQNRHQKLLTQKVISPQQLSNNRSRINHLLKKLNMVLIGQAGLADGSEHVRELYSFQEKLMNSRQKKITTELHKEIGQHYISVFSPAQRDDFTDLLEMYHNISKQATPLKKKKKKALKLNPKINRWRKAPGSIPTGSIPTQQVQHSNTENNVKGEEIVASIKNPQIMTKNLVFYHKRLLNARPMGSALKKTRMELVRKLHSFIASSSRKEKMSSKAMKKMRKAQEQAQLFLANV